MKELWHRKQLLIIIKKKHYVCVGMRSKPMGY